MNNRACSPSAVTAGFMLCDRLVFPPLLLAPMAGLTHSALRTLVHSFGGTGILTTEMLSARSLPVENPEVSPFLVRTDAERPLFYQLLVSREEEVEPAIDALHRFGADGVDLNLGCPAPRVRKSGGGSSLASAPQRVKRIVAAARKATTLPLTAKIRLGPSLDEQRLRNFCLMLVGEGIDALTVHARLEREPFCRKPRWEWVGRVKEWVPVPVIANGSITSVADARRCLAQSSADGLMIGRAAAQRPWILADIARNLYGVDLPEPVICLPLLYGRFVRSLQERFQPERRLGRLKEFTHYFACNYPFGHHLASSVQASHSIQDAWGKACTFFARSDPDGRERMESLEDVFLK